MICRNGHTVPDNVLICPACLAGRSDHALRELQIEFLRKVARGEFSYALRVAKGKERHVMMYGSWTRAFCGKELQAKPPITYEPYTDQTLEKVCAGCRIAIASVMQEVVP